MKNLGWSGSLELLDHVVTCNVKNACVCVGGWGGFLPVNVQTSHNASPASSRSTFSAVLLAAALDELPSPHHLREVLRELHTHIHQT